MAAEFPLSLIIRAVDKATGPLREINARMQKFTAPVRRLNNAFRALSDEAGIPRLVKSVAGVGRSLGRVGHEAASLGLKITGMAAAAAFGLYRLVRGAVDVGDKLAEMAQRVGLSVDAYAQLQFAAGQADIEQEAFNGAMDQFNKRLGEAKAGAGPLLAFLSKVSPALAKQVVGAKSTEEALFLMAGAFEKLKDPAQIAALSAAGFGRSGLQMGQFLGQGEKGVRAFMAQFFELTGSLEAYAKASSELDNVMRLTKTAFFGLAAAAGAALFPAFSKLSEALTKFFVANRDGIAKWATEASAAISAWVSGGGLDRLVATMKEWGKTIGAAVEWLGGLKVAAGIAAAILAGPLLLSVVALGGALWTVGAAVLPILVAGVMALLPKLGLLFASFMALNLANPIVWIVAGVAALGAAAFAVWKYWEPIAAFFERLWGTIKKIASGPLGALKGLFTGAEFGAAGDAMPSSGPALGAAAAVRANDIRSGRNTETRVLVDFANLPRGARVTADPRGTAPLDLGMGYSMIGG